MVPIVPTPRSRLLSERCCVPIDPPMPNHRWNDDDDVNVHASDEEVYVAAKAVDADMIDYDSDDNPIVIDKKKIEPIPPLHRDSIDYDPFNKDFYKENSSISVIHYFIIQLKNATFFICCFLFQVLRML